MSKKKSLLSLLLFCLVMPVALLFAACDGTAQEEPVEPAGHTHTWSDEWSFDENQHWHICTGEDCDEIHDLGEHVYNDPHSTDCIICGKTRQLDHTPKSAWVTNETHHWHECNETGCELKFNYEEHEVTSPYGYCSCDYYCGFTLTYEDVYNGYPINNVVINEDSPTFFRFNAKYSNKDFVFLLGGFIKTGTDVSSSISIYRKSGSNYSLTYENVKSGEGVHISSSGDYYCVIENSEANIGFISVREEEHEATMENHGVTPCGAYLGTTHQANAFDGENKLTIVPQTQANKLSYYRIADINGFTFNFETNTEQTVKLFYINTVGELVELTLGSSESIDVSGALVIADDPYIYIVVSASANMTASENIVVTKTPLE